MQKNIQISVIAAIVVGIGAMMITSAFAPATAAAYRHHHHSVHISIHITQKVHQSNECSNGAECENNAVNIIGNGNSNIGNSP